MLRSLAVVGAGQMGSGIAFVGAVKAMIDRVVMVDASQKQLDLAMRNAEKYMARDVSKGRLAQADADAAMARLATATSIDAIGDVDFAVEAVSEDLALKKKIFQQLDAATGTLELAAAMGKTTTQSADVPGFIANRILMPYINEAALVLEHGVATAQDIDTTMKLGTNVPMGPLMLADFIGLDTCLAIMKVLHKDFGDSKYRPAPLLQKYVDAGLLGVKSGQGFHDHTKK